jgi:hypothetical protein
MRVLKKPAVLWVVQSVLATLFLFSGVFKLVMPPEAFAGPIPLPVAFIRFIGVCETAGALGLILPGLLRIARQLTPLAAVGLVTIMTGATVTSVIWMGIGPAIPPFVVGLLAIAVAFGRREWAKVL